MPRAQPLSRRRDRSAEQQLGNGKTPMIATTSSAGTALPVVPDIGRNSRNAAPITDHAVGELRGVVGARLPRRVHMIANSGESTMTQTGSIEPTQFDGAVQPKIDQFIRSSE